MLHKIIASFVLAATLVFSSYADAGAPRRPVGKSKGEMDGGPTVRSLLEINKKKGQEPFYQSSGGKIKLEALGHGLAKGTQFMVEVYYEGKFITGEFFKIKKDDMGESVTKVELSFGGRKNLFAGLYELKAVFESARQNKKVREKLEKILGEDFKDYTARGSVFIGEKEDVDKQRDMLIKHYRKAIEKLKELQEKFDKEYNETYEKTTGKKTNGQKIKDAKPKPFRASDWRKFIDPWFKELGRVNDTHEALKKRYEAMRWGDCYKQLREMIGSLDHTGITSSIKLYKDNKQEPEDMKKSNMPGDPGSHLKSFKRNLGRIENRLNAKERVRAMLKNAEQLKKEMEEEEKKKKREERKKKSGR